MQKYLESQSQITEEKALEPSNSSSSILDESTDADNDSVVPANFVPTPDEEEDRNL